MVTADRSRHREGSDGGRGAADQQQHRKAVSLKSGRARAVKKRSAWAYVRMGHKPKSVKSIAMSALA
jgi:hypothetical protein